MIMQNFVNNLWLLTQMFFCHPIVNLTASWWKGSNVTSSFMEQSRSTRWVSPAPGVSRLFSKTAEDLIKVVVTDQPVQAASESQVIDKLHAFFVGLSTSTFASSQWQPVRPSTWQSSRSGGMRIVD